MANAQAKANPNILPTQQVLLSGDRAKGMDGSFAWGIFPLETSASKWTSPSYFYLINYLLFCVCVELPQLPQEQNKEVVGSKGVCLGFLRVCCMYV